MCGVVHDSFGHHVQTCKQASGTVRAWNHAHTSVVRFFQAIAEQAGFRVSKWENQVDTHSDGGKKGDLQIRDWTIGRATSLVADVTVTHPRTGVSGTSVPLGSWKKTAVRDAENGKVRKHRKGYALGTITGEPTAFVPLVCSTYGGLSSDSLRLLYLLVVKHLCVQERAEPQLSEQESNAFRGFLFSRSRLMLGCMIAKAGAARNMADVSTPLPQNYIRRWTTPVSCLVSEVDCLYQTAGSGGQSGG
jgi:hypothetical protein